MLTDTPLAEYTKGLIGTAAHLVPPAAAYVTGASLTIEGGMIA